MSTIYVDAAWASKTNGDKVTVNGTEYTIGVDAFATSKAAYMAARDLGGNVSIDLTNAGIESITEGTIGLGNAYKDGVYTITGGNGRNTTSYGISTANTNITVKFEDAAFRIGKAYFANSGSALFVDNSVIGTAYYSGHNSGWFTAGNGNISISDSIFGINYANFTDEEIAGMSRSAAELAVKKDYWAAASNNNGFHMGTAAEIDVEDSTVSVSWISLVDRGLLTLDNSVLYYGGAISIGTGWVDSKYGEYNSNEIGWDCQVYWGNSPLTSAAGFRDGEVATLTVTDSIVRNLGGGNGGDGAHVQVGGSVGEQLFGGELNLIRSEFSTTLFDADGNAIAKDYDMLVVKSNGTVNMEDSKLISAKVVNEGEFNVTGESLVKVGSGSGNIDLNGKLLAGSTLGKMNIYIDENDSVIETNADAAMSSGNICINYGNKELSKDATLTIVGGGALNAGVLYMGSSNMQSELVVSGKDTKVVFGNTYMFYNSTVTVKEGAYFESGYTCMYGTFNVDGASAKFTSGGIGVRAYGGGVGVMNLTNGALVECAEGINIGGWPPSYGTTAASHNGVFNADASNVSTGHFRLMEKSAEQTFDVIANFTNGSMLSAKTLTVGAGTNFNIDASSFADVTTLAGTGTITVDATNFAGGIVKVVDADKSTFTGEITVENLAEGVKVIYGADGDVVLSDLVSEKFYVDAAFTGNTGAEVAEGKFINVNAFASLGDAVAAADANISEFVVSSSTSEALSGKTISGKIVAAGDAVTVADSVNDNYVYIKNAVIGENVTLDADYIYLSAGTENVIDGNIVSGTTFYVSAKKAVINGTATVYTTMSRRYAAMDEGIYIVGNAEAGKAAEAAVQYKSVNYIGHYSGTFSIKNAAVESGYILLNNTNDNDGTGLAAKIVLDNAYLATIGGPNTQPGQLLMNGDAIIELTNKSVLDISGPKQFGYLGMTSGVITVDDSTFIMGTEGQGANTVGGTLNVVNGGSVISLGKVINNGSINISGDSLFSATKITGAGTITIDAAGVTEMNKVIDVNAAIEGALTVKNLEAGMGYLVAEDGDVIIAEVGAIKVDDAYGAYAAGTVVDGMVVGLNAFADIHDAINAADAATSSITVAENCSSALYAFAIQSITTENANGLVIDMGNHGISMDKNLQYTLNGSTEFDADSAIASEICNSYETMTFGENVTIKADVLLGVANLTYDIQGTMEVNAVAMVMGNNSYQVQVVNVAGTLTVADNIVLRDEGTFNVTGAVSAANVYAQADYALNINGAAQFGMVEAAGTVSVGAGAVVNVSDTAKIGNLDIAEGGAMAIDAAGVTGTKLLLDVDTIANAGTLTVENAASNMFLVTAEDGDIWLVDNTIYVNAEWAGAEFGTEVAAGKFFGLNAFATLDAISTEASQGIRKVVYTAAEDATVTIVGEAYTAYRYNNKNSYVLAGREVEVEVSAGDVVFEFTNAKGDFKLTSSLEQDSSVISTDAIYVNFAWREDASSLGNGMALGENAFVDFESIDPSLSQGVRSVNYIADANGTLTLIIDADAYTAYSINGKNSYVLADRTVTLELEVVAGETYEIKFTNAKGDYDLAATFEPAAVLPDGMADDADDVVTGANVVDMSADSSFTNWVGSEDKVDWFAITNFDPQRTTFTLDVAEGGSRVSVAIYSQTGDGALRQVRSWSTATSGSATLNLSASTKYFVKVTGTEDSTYTMQLA